MTSVGETTRMPNLDGPCRDTDADLWFSQPHSRAHNQAIALCRSCPSRQPCLEYALNVPQPGVWGATSEVERRRISRRRGVPYHVAGQRWAS